MEDILEFTGNNRWLSNFYPAPVTYSYLRYPTVENAYQAAKTLDVTQRSFFLNCSPSTAKAMSKVLTMRDDWDSVKVSIMKNLIEQKFSYGSILGDKLLSTGDCHIEEGNYWGDTFWGVCRGVGQNQLGILLMNQRENLRC